MTRRSLLIAAGASTAGFVTRAAQNMQKRASPHETVSVDLDGKKITITYGRPYLKGRHVGEEVAPYGKVWRLGADEATKLTVTAYTAIPKAFELMPGSYSLFAIPNPDKWTIIVNKVADQWGAFNYDPSKDVGRFDLPVQKLSSPVEEFTIALNKEANNVARLTMEWGTASVSTQLKVL